jgi:hypothetical protein
MDRGEKVTLVHEPWCRGKDRRRAATRDAKDENLDPNEGWDLEQGRSISYFCGWTITLRAT